MTLRYPLRAALALLLMTVLGTSAAPMAQTTLNPGDIAVIGMIADGDESFALLATVDIETGTDIKITDKGVSADGTIQPNRESIRRFTTTAPIAAGEVLVAAEDGTTFYPDALGTPTGGTSFISLSVSGDQLLIFQGDAGDNPNLVFLYSSTPFDQSFDITGGGDPDNVDQNSTALPAGLIDGTSAIDFDPHVDNASYDRSFGTSGTRDEILALVGNATNYTTSNDRDFALPMGAFTITPATADPITLPVTFEDDSVDYELQDFGGAASLLIEDPEDATNTVVQTVRPEVQDGGPTCFAGTTVADMTGFDERIPFTADETTMTVRVWSPEAGIRVLFKVEEVGNPDFFVETLAFTTVANEYETLVFDFSNPMPNDRPISFGGNYNKASIFFDFQCGFDAAAPADPTYYWDDVAFGAPPAADPMIVINEVDADQAGTDAEEFVELYNAGTEAASLDGLALVFFNGSDNLSYEPAFDLDGVSIAAGDYYVICGDAANVPNCDMEVGTGTTNLIQNGADAVALLMADAASYPNDTAIPMSGIVDAIVYGTNDDDDDELLDALGQSVQYNDTATESIQRSPDGDATIITATPTPGAANALITEPQAFTSLLRGENERPEPADTDAKGGATAVVDVDGTTVTVTGAFDGLTGNYAAAHLHGGAADETGPVVVALTASPFDDMRGGVFEAMSNTFTVRETFADSIRNGLVYVNIHSSAFPAGEIRGQLGTETHALPFALSGANERPDPAMTDATGSGTATLDGSEISVSGTFSGLTGDYQASHIHAGAMDETGGVVVGLNPMVDADMRGGTFEAASNTFTLRTTFADSVRAGLAYVNIHSTAFPAGEIRGQIGFEAPPMAVALSDARAQGVGATVTVEGTVSRAMGDFVYIQDDTAGLVIRQPDDASAFSMAVADGTIQPGTVLRVTGTLSEFNGLLQLNDDDVESYMVLSQGDAPMPQTVTLAQLAANGEDFEGELVQVENVTFSEAGNGQFAAGTTYEIVDPTSGNNAVTVRTPREDDTMIDGVDIPDGTARVIGVVGQFDREDPRDEGYQILPIQADDVVLTSGVSTEAGAAELSLVIANPLRGDATVRFSLDVPGPARLALYDALGRQVAVVAEGDLPTGAQTARLDAGSLATGVYILRLESAASAMSQTVTIVR